MFNLPQFIFLQYLVFAVCLFQRGILKGLEKDGFCLNISIKRFKDFHTNQPAEHWCWCCCERAKFQLWTWALLNKYISVCRDKGHDGALDSTLVCFVSGNPHHERFGQASMYSVGSKVVETEWWDHEEWWRDWIWLSRKQFWETAAFSYEAELREKGSALIYSQVDRVEWDPGVLERLELVGPRQKEEWPHGWSAQATAGFFPFFFFLDCKSPRLRFLRKGNGRQAQSQNNENQEANIGVEESENKHDENCGGQV